MSNDLMQRMEDGIAWWENELKKYDADDLLKGYNEHSWTLGQVYSHVIMSAAFFFKMGRRCFEAEHSDGPLTDYGVDLFKTESFPPMKIKVPERYAHVPRQPEDFDELRKGLALNRTMARALAERLPDMDPDRKLEHAIFGWINAEQWFRVAILHFLHHRRQKGWIDEALQKDASPS